MHISSVFFAIFDEDHGRRIVYQVPENLITTPPPRTRADTIVDNTRSVVDETGITNESPVQENGVHDSGNDARIPPKPNSLSRSTASRISTTHTNSPTIMTNAATPTTSLFEWQLVSQFVIPPSDICGRLTVSTTKKHRIVGFPVFIRDNKYERSTFQFNVCFVFAKDMDYGKEAGISCYEPVVRKLARVLTACEVRWDWSIRALETYPL